MLTQDQKSYLVKTFTDRMKLFGINPNTKKYRGLQTEFFVGAVSALDMGTGTVTIPADWCIAILRNDIIK